MKSTGECWAWSGHLKGPLQSLAGSGLTVPTDGAILATIADRDKDDAVKYLRNSRNLASNYMPQKARQSPRSSRSLGQSRKQVEEGSPNIMDLLKETR